MGAFASPNRAGVMNSLPPEHRGAGGGMNQTFQNSAQVLSIGIFFTLMILGLSATLPHTLAAGLEAHGVAHATAAQIGHLPPVSILFAAFLGYNPAQELLGPHLLASPQPRRRGRRSPAAASSPACSASPFRSGLHEAFGFAIVACLIAAAASWSRGGRYVNTEHVPAGTPGEGAVPSRAGR